MGTLKSDIIHTWFYNSEEEAKKHDLKKAVGYTLVIDGMLKYEEGKETKFVYQKSNTEVSN